MVKRYNPAQMTEAFNGGWVRGSDYDALRRLCLDARYFVKNFTCRYQEEELLRSKFLESFPDDAKSDQ